MDPILQEILVAIAFAGLASVIFTFVGLVSGTDETATISPVTLIVVLLGAPPSAVLAFFLAAAVSKHISHAIPTALLGIPGDTMAIPLMREGQPAAPSRRAAYRAAKDGIERGRGGDHRGPGLGRVRHRADALR